MIALGWALIFGVVTFATATLFGTMIVGLFSSYSDSESDRKSRLSTKNTIVIVLSLCVFLGVLLINMGEDSRCADLRSEQRLAGAASSYLPWRCY